MLEIKRCPLYIKKKQCVEYTISRYKWIGGFRTVSYKKQEKIPSL